MIRPPDGLSPVIRTIVDAVPPGRALDVATGRGRNALALAERGWTVDAIDISRAKLDRARERAAGRSVPGAINWLLADVDRYGFPTAVYDLVTVSFFDARDRRGDLIDALTAGGLLCFEHYLEAPGDEAGPGDRFRFEPNELLDARSELAIVFYAERRVGGEPLVTLVAREESTVPRWRPPLSFGDDGP